VILAEKIPRPDLIVYLTADTDVLMERIAIRDRSYERTMERAYIESLNQAYEEFFAHHAATPVLPIDTNDLNIVQRKEDLAVVVQSIRAKLAESAYQQPLL
jgi:deoxyguanosine kinase